MVSIEPIPDRPAAVVDAAERSLVVADYHAGIEVGFRFEEGVELESRAPQRKATILELIDMTRPDRLIMLGDVTHSIGEPGGAERAELEVLFEDIDLPVTVAKGNHDGLFEAFVESSPEHFERITVTPSEGACLNSLGIAHGHTWPDPTVLEADVVCVGHEHPCVQLQDEVGGTRIERVWIRGQIDPTPFESAYETVIDDPPELVVFPAFNDLCGGTWVNVPEQEFLSPFLPAGLDSGTVHLLDGTHLGNLQSLRSKDSNGRYTEE